MHFAAQDGTSNQPRCNHFQLSLLPAKDGQENTLAIFDVPTDLDAQRPTGIESSRESLPCTQASSVNVNCRKGADAADVPQRVISTQKER